MCSMVFTSKDSKDQGRWSDIVRFSEILVQNTPSEPLSQTIPKFGFTVTPQEKIEQVNQHCFGYNQPQKLGMV